MFHTKFYLYESKTQAKKKLPIHTGIATFFQSLRHVSDTSIRAICQEAHVSTRTYHKIMRHEPVKPECYEKLFIALVRAVNEEEFLPHWAALGLCLYDECESFEL